MFSVGEHGAGCLLHPRETRTPNVGAGRIGFTIDHDHVELLSCWFRVADGWFDDPIGLLARAYIFIPPMALGESLLAQSYLIPKIKLLPDP